MSREYLLVINPQPRPMHIQRENQKLSYSGIVFLVVLWLVMIVPIGVSAAGPLPWLDYLYVISYVKLGVTPIKYIPQVCLYLTVSSDNLPLYYSHCFCIIMLHQNSLCTV